MFSSKEKLHQTSNINEMICENYSKEDILNFALENDMLDLSGIQAEMSMKKREELLKMHKYKVFKASDGRWKTTLPDDEKKNGRRLISRSTKEELEDELVKHYKKISASPTPRTLREVYPLWLQSRKLEVCSIGTVKKNDQDWKRYYLNDPIIDVSMVNLTEQKLKDWAHKMIIDHHMNKREYYNMAIIIKQCFQYAAVERFIPYDTWNRVRINTRKFVREKKKENVTQIYFADEMYKLIDYSLRMFLKNNKNITALAIPLLFLSGLRVGELVALKYDDITDEDILVRNSESMIYEMDDQGNFKYVGREIVDHTKTDAGERNIPLTNGAKTIIGMIHKASDFYGFYDDGYIFCPNSKRIISVTIDHKLYNYCDKIGIPRKSAHKIRKTYISRLINDGRLDIDTICKVAGHTDLKTTFHSYCFGLEEKKIVYGKFEEILDANNKWSDMPQTYLTIDVNKCKQM